MVGPPIADFLLNAIPSDKPLAIILAGHNGSGKSTLWQDRLSDFLRIPLINADRLTRSILPEPPADKPHYLPPWAVALRDNDETWQRVSQTAVMSIVDSVTEQKLPFAYETVFSHWKKLPDGSIESKAELISRFQAKGYSVALLFVGLASQELSIFRVRTRRDQGGHAVPEDKLISRYPRTQQAVRVASTLADLTLMFDNSRGAEEAFSLVRAQAKTDVFYDCRTGDSKDADLVKVSSGWLSIVAPLAV